MARAPDHDDEHIELGVAVLAMAPCGANTTRLASSWRGPPSAQTTPSGPESTATRSRCVIWLHACTPPGSTSAPQSSQTRSAQQGASPPYSAMSSVRRVCRPVISEPLVVTHHQLTVDLLHRLQCHSDDDEQGGSLVDRTVDASSGARPLCVRSRARAIGRSDGCTGPDAQPREPRRSRRTPSSFERPAPRRPSRRAHSSTSRLSHTFPADSSAAGSGNSDCSRTIWCTR